jgi:hypothetical protein
MSLFLIESVLFFAGCGFALWRGGGPERLASAGFLVAWGLTLLCSRLEHLMQRTGVLAVDAAVLVLLFALALRTRRKWTVWAAVFQLLNVATHAAVLFDRHIHNYAFASTLILWSFLVLGALVVGTLQAPKAAR